MTAAVRSDDTGRPSLPTVVCGSRWGQFYAAALASGDPRFTLAGILGQGSPRSQALAARHGVPLYTAVDEVPETVRVACVVVPSAVAGGTGAELARAFLGRGVHVLQEHPVHERELADCLRLARVRRTQYRLNTFYPQVAPVARFIGVARELAARHRPVFVDAVCAVQVSFDLLDILALALGGIRPWSIAQVSPPGAATGPYRSLTGTVAGTPLTLRVQNQLVPGDDAHAHFLHRITVGTEAGCLTLANTHGPLLWDPPLRPATDQEGLFVLDIGRDPHLGNAVTQPLGPATAPSWARVTGELWPAAVRRALAGLHDGVLAGSDPLRGAQRHLLVARAWSELTGVLGYPEPVGTPGTPGTPPLSAAELLSAAPGVVESAGGEEPE